MAKAKKKWVVGFSDRSHSWTEERDYLHFLSWDHEYADPDIRPSGVLVFEPFEFVAEMQIIGFIRGRSAAQAQLAPKSLIFPSHIHNQLKVLKPPKLLEPGMSKQSKGYWDRFSRDAPCTVFVMFLSSFEDMVFTTTIDHGYIGESLWGFVKKGANVGIEWLGKPDAKTFPA